jgi:hypothetical protein
MYRSVHSSYAPGAERKGGKNCVTGKMAAAAGATAPNKASVDKGLIFLTIMRRAKTNHRMPDPAQFLLNMGFIQQPEG